MKHEHISFNGRTIDVDMKSYLSQHDIVYLTPATEGYEGFPLGNGDIGAMAWTPPDSLHFQINKCDTWDDGPDEPFGAWDDGNKAEAYTSLRHCGQLQIVPGLPVFDWKYLEDFNAKLSLADATASWYAKSSLGEVNCNAFVAKDPKVIVINYEDELVEPVTRSIKLARWGTRVFEHWYATIKRDQFLGPLGTKAGCDGDVIWIEQSTRSLNFAMACKIVCENSNSRVIHSREAVFENDSGRKCSFALYISVVTSEQEQDPLSAVIKTVTEAAKTGSRKITEIYKKQWAQFWSKSFVNIPDKYLENLWYLNLYQVGSSSSGKYPPHFINSLWAWTQDARPWNHYYHWNQQIYTWPLLTSGHPELIEPYAKWRLEGLPHAIEDAKNVHNAQGAFYSDIANRKGCQDVVDPQDYASNPDSERLKEYMILANYNLTPGAQIAHDLYRHYQYTLDENFLKTYTYPIMREWVKFMTSWLQKEDDGLYHDPRSDPYERTWMQCKDTTNTLAYVRLIFPIFVSLAQKSGTDEQLAQTADHVVENLADFIYMHLPEKIVTTGEIPAGSPIIAAGKDIETDAKLMWHSKKEHYDIDGMALNAQLSPVYPTGLVGIDQKDSKLYNALVNTVQAAPGGAFGHGVEIICKARMGQVNEIEKDLKKWVQDYQLFPQGLFCYSKITYENDFKKGLAYTPQSTSNHLHSEVKNIVKVMGSKSAEEIEVPTKHFAHIGLEPGSIFQTVINEMLLQSHGSKIRVFPATPSPWQCQFTLHAIGGFIVTSEKTERGVKYVAIKSKYGQDCCVVNPWDQKTEIRIMDMSTMTEIISSSFANEFKFATQNGHIYILEKVSEPLNTIKTKTISGRPNHSVKKLGNAMVGKPRQF